MTMPRDVPDIAMSSAGHDAYLVINNGSLVAIYGTSAAAPSTAGIVAILNQYQIANGYQKAAGLGNINPQLYRLAQVQPTAFHDIVTGNNIVPCTQGSPSCLTGSYGYNAGPGYDLATGLGSLDANSFVTQWNVPTRAATVAVSTNLPRATVNDTITLNVGVSASNAATGGVPTGSVSFSLGTLALGTAPLTVFSSASAGALTFPAYMLNGTGTATIYAEYSGDAAFSSAGKTVQLVVAAPAGVSGIIPSVSNKPGVSHFGQSGSGVAGNGEFA